MIGPQPCYPAGGPEEPQNRARGETFSYLATTARSISELRILSLVYWKTLGKVSSPSGFLTVGQEDFWSPEAPPIFDDGGTSSHPNRFNLWLDGGAVGHIVLVEVFASVAHSSKAQSNKYTLAWIWGNWTGKQTNLPTYIDNCATLSNSCVPAAVARSSTSSK